jgi:hypothetical protein
MNSLPEALIDPALKDQIDSLAANFPSLEDAEQEALTSDLGASLHQSWTGFCELVRTMIANSGYIVVRGLEADDGRSLLIVSSSLGAAFETYRPGRVVKRFQMSPWTEELSHTTRAGDFHTDGNVSTSPPGSTALQCEVEDPGAPRFAEQRVAFLPALLERLAQGDDDDAAALAFLTEEEATMAQEHSPEMWRGRLVENGTIRYHPASLRVASKRLGLGTSVLERRVARIHRAAMDASVPFHTRPGDTVLVSNRTALHYRGECSVRFTRFPTEFESRSLLVLHMKERIE